MKVDGQQIKYSKMGEGEELIVMLPPPIADHRIYCDLQRRLKSRIKTVAIDLPQTSNVEKTLAVLEQIIRTGTLENFHLMATSATGWLAQLLAPKFQSQLSSMILINAIWDNEPFREKYATAFKATKLVPGFKFRKEVIKYSARFIRGISHKKPLEDYFQKRVKDLGKGKVRNQLSLFLEPHNPPKPINSPMLIYHTLNDPVIPVSEANKLHKRYSDSDLIKIDSDAHLPFLSDPTLFVTKCNEFLSNH